MESKEEEDRKNLGTTKEVLGSIRELEEYIEKGKYGIEEAKIRIERTISRIEDLSDEKLHAKALIEEKDAVRLVSLLKEAEQSVMELRKTLRSKLDVRYKKEIEKIETETYVGMGHWGRCEKMAYRARQAKETKNQLIEIANTVMHGDVLSQHEIDVIGASAEIVELERIRSIGKLERIWVTPKHPKYVLISAKEEIDRRVIDKGLQNPTISEQKGTEIGKRFYMEAGN